MSTVIDRVGLQKSAIYDRIKRGKFPKQLRIDGASVWLESDIETWIAQVIAGQWQNAQTQPHP